MEEVMVGPVSIGINRFVLQANAPNPAIIANQDLIGVTVILITCSFMDNKFVQIGYYVNNEYTEPFEPENFPNPVDISKLYRNILADQPRVTRFAIDWSGETSGAGNLMTGNNSAEANQAEDDEDVSELSLIGTWGCSSAPVYSPGCDAYTHAMSASLTRKSHFFSFFRLAVQILDLAGGPDDQEVDSEEEDEDEDEEDEGEIDLEDMDEEDSADEEDEEGDEEVRALLCWVLDA